VPAGFRVTTAASRGEPGAVAMAVRTAYAELGYPSFIRGSFDPFAHVAVDLCAEGSSVGG